LKATEIIYSALEKSGIELPELPLEKTEGNCMMCGKEIKEGVRYKKVVSGNFTDYDVFANIQGTHICKECATCVKTRELRINNIIADKDNLYLLKKNDLEEYLFNIDKYVSGDFVIGITKSFKKHNSYRCKVNNNTNVFIIREEDKEYVFDRANMKVLYDIIWDMYMYFQKDEILTGQYSIARIEEYGLERFKAKGKERVDIGSGFYKNYHMPVVIQSYKTITFYVRGDMEEVKRLLENYIFYLGKKGSQGFGQVGKWEFEEIEEDWSIWKDGKLMRPIPAEECKGKIEEMMMKQIPIYARQHPILPPYWRKETEVGLMTEGI